MLKHEAAVTAAKDGGAPIPALDLSLPGRSKMTVQPTESMERAWKEKIIKLAPDEQAAEEAALKADLQVKADVASRIARLKAAEQVGRDARTAEGKVSISDSITSIFKWK